MPLREDEPVAVIGYMAQSLRYQGAGSSHINPTRLSQPLDFLPGVSYAPGCDERGDTTDALIAEAVRAAKAAKTAVVFAGLPGRYESEGFDRESMALPEGHNRLIQAVSAANPNTVVVLLCGAPVECPWADQVKAILYMGLPGQAGGEAIADLLYGRATPSGKLAETWPLRYEDCISSPYYGKTKDALYMEGIYVGYRYYDKAGKDVRWPFGYGLSYTKFGYTDLRVDGNTVTVTIQNIGNRIGAEIVQLYVEAPQNGLHCPVRELKGFQKVSLTPGEKKTVQFTLTDRDFSVWQDGWKVPVGDYTICVESSSRDLPLRQTIHVNGTALPVPPWQHGSFYETCAGAPTQALLEAAMGRPYTPEVLKKGSFTMDNTVEEMKDFSLVMKIMYKAVEKTIAKGFGGKADYDNPEFRMMMAASAGSSLRSMQTSGGLRDGIMQGILDMANGHFFRGIVRMIRG
ncbi:MAG: glycoside hydrolase family 3 C-terminal domain-containing protein [Clostridia bacterium]|nr:glycoside hydrolase family 3 C-terminal domain-containing protein [Clostridia bacterium]